MLFSLTHPHRLEAVAHRRNAWLVGKMSQLALKSCFVALDDVAEMVITLFSSF
jgi:hypothetical protein